jgi:hypothetical protein
MVLRISSPPAVDRVVETDSPYPGQYASALPSVAVQLLHSAGTASRLLIPLQQSVPPALIARARTCGATDGLPCTTMPDDDSTPEEEQLGGCLVAGGAPGVGDRTCSFVASGEHTAVAQSVNAVMVRVCRAGTVVTTLDKGRALKIGTDAYPLEQSIPSVAGDTIEARLIDNGSVGIGGTWGFIAVGNPSANGAEPMVPCPPP